MFCYNTSFLQLIAVEIVFIAYPCDSGSNLRIEENGFIHKDNMCGFQRPDPLKTFSNTLQVIFSAAHDDIEKNAFFLRFRASE